MTTMETLRMQLHPIPRTRPSRRRVFLVSLLDALNMVMPTTLLLAMISSTAWYAWWL